MEVTSFFSRLLRPPTLSRRASDQPNRDVPLDDVEAFERAWTVIQAVLLEPDERQLLRGIQSTVVPAQLSWIVQALVHEHEVGEHGAPTGGCLEYFLNEGMLRHLVELSEDDKPFGVRAEVLKAINHLLLLLPDSFLIHASVHRPLLQLIRSSVGDETADGVSKSHVGAAAADERDVGGFGRAESKIEREGKLVDLLSIVCAKLRAAPLLLLILFHDRVSSANPASIRQNMPRSTSSRSLGQEHLDYLIFSFLLRYVHYDGRLGECARLGSECLLDIAFGAADVAGAQGGELSSEGDDTLQRAKLNLAEQIVEGDSADVLAAGLGAVYSVLPFKIRLPMGAEARNDEHGGMQLGTSAIDSMDDRADQTLQTVRTRAVEDQLKMLLEVWAFINGIMVRCQLAANGETMADHETRSIAARVRQQLRNSIRISFLDNVLYPSILECSTTDGSAVAVLSYIRVILRLDDIPACKEPLGQFVFAYLAGFDVSGEARGVSSESKSDGPLATRFTIKDLLLDAIGSQSTEAATMALGVLSGLLDGYCDKSAIGLLDSARGQHLTAFARDCQGLGLTKIREGAFHREAELDLDLYSAGGPSRAAFQADSPSVGVHDDLLDSSVKASGDVKLYGALLEQISRLDTTAGDEQWHAYVKDSYALLSQHACFRVGLIGRDLDGRQSDHVREEVADSWALRPSDKVLQELLTMLRHLFSHTAAFNVALTAALSSIAACPRCSLEGWSLRVRPSSDDRSAHPALHSQSADIATDPTQVEDEDRLPILYVMLRELGKQIAVYRSRVTGFDRYLSERRQGLHFVEGVEDAMSVMLDIVPTQTSRPDWTPQREQQRSTTASPKPSRGLSSSLLSFLTPRKKTSHGPSSSLSNSPFSFMADQEETASPHASHYHKTSSVTLDPLTAAAPSRSAWAPERLITSGPPGHHSRTISESDATSDDLFGPTQNTFNANLPEAPSKVSLSAILDNCVILEEFIKETIGHIVARQTLGIDDIGGSLAWDSGTTF